MLRLVALTVLLGGAIASAAASDLDEDMKAFVDALPTEADECEFVWSMCRGASASVSRAEGTPGTRDLLATRQSLIAGSRVDELVAAARAIERKRGKRPACFDDEVCRGWLPRPRDRSAQ